MADTNEIEKLKRMVEMGAIPQEAMDGYLQGVTEREMEKRRYELEREIARIEYERQSKLGQYNTPYIPSTTSSRGTSLTEKELTEMIEKLSPRMTREEMDKWKLNPPWKQEYPFAPWEDDEREMAELRKKEAIAKEKARKAAAEARARKKAAKRAKMLEKLLGYYEIQKT